MKYYFMNSMLIGGTAAHILNLVIRWRCVVNFTPKTFHPWGSPSPSERRIMGTRADLGEQQPSLAGNGTQNDTHSL
jgi:hypothetical protein